MLQKEWILKAQAPTEHLHRYNGFSPVLAQILFNRGLEDPKSAHEFIHGSDLNDDPFRFQDMDKAVARITQAIAADQAIAVYGDFDADGVSSTTLMVQVLDALGADVVPFIPDRAAEGYGLNTPALQRLAQSGVQLIVTVDCGIRAVAEVARCTRDGLDIIVTDHHTLGPDLPPALAVIDPQRDDCPGETSLAGVGVAFMLAKALLLHRWKCNRDNYPKNLRLSDLLDLVALGTVADVVPLNSSLNRRLVRHGLRTINERRRPGLNALANVAGLNPGAVTASHIGFVLGPRINAAGRLDSAMTAYELLSSIDPELSMARAVELQQLNARRQALTREAQAAISDQVTDEDSDALIFAGDERILPGIVGLVAGRLAERFYRPAVVLEIGDEQSRGSCRSIPEFNISNALDECADLLVRHGGHAMAAGFTVKNSNIENLQQELTSKARASLGAKLFAPKLYVDCGLELRALDMELRAELDCLEPTGHGNPPATFMARNLNVRNHRRVGAEGNHLKLRLSADDSPAIDAIGFGLGEWSKMLPSVIDAAFQPEINEWNGKRSLQLRLLDIRPASNPV